MAMKRISSGLVMMLASAIVCSGPWTTAARAGVVPCLGDCNRDDTLTVSELVTGVNMALGRLAVEFCPEFDPSGDEQVAVNELVAAVYNALSGCGSGANHPPQASDV